MTRIGFLIPYFATLSVLALLSQSAIVLVIAAFMLVIPALVLVASNTILLYSLAFLPFFVALSFAKRALWVLLPAFALSAGIAGAIATIPTRAGPEFDRFVAPYLAQDFSTPPLRGLRSVLLEHPLAEPNSEDGCVVLCQKLLYGGDVQSVVQVHHDGNVRYWIEQRYICPELPASTPTPFAQSGSLAGQCLVGERVAEAHADVTITTERADDDALEAVALNEEHRFRLWGVREVRRFDVFEQQGGAMTHVERRTNVSGEVATAPFWISTQSTGPMGFVPATARRDVELGGHSIESVLHERYGWRIAPLEGDAGSAPAATASYMNELLARPATPGVAFTHAEHQAIRAGLHDIVRREQHTPEEIETLRAVIRHPAVTDHMDLFWKDDLVVLLPDAIARLEAPLEHDEENFRHKLAQFAAQAPLETLRPYADRIIAIMSDNARGRYASSFAALAPQLTTRDVSPILLRMLGNGVRDGPIVGLCYAARPGRMDISAGLGGFLSTSPFNARPGTTRAAIAGYIRSASYEQAQRIEANLRNSDRARYRRELARVRRESWPAACDEYRR